MGRILFAPWFSQRETQGVNRKTINGRNYEK